MTPPHNPGAQDAQLKSLHERVNAMLDIPTPKESDAFPLPVETTLDGMAAPTNPPQPTAS